LNAVAKLSVSVVPVLGTVHFSATSRVDCSFYAVQAYKHLV
jgi:hypothetical protein